MKCFVQVYQQRGINVTPFLKQEINKQLAIGNPSPEEGSQRTVIHR